MLMSIIPAADWFAKALRTQSPQSAREAFERIKLKRPSDEPTPEVVTHDDTQNPDSPPRIPNRVSSEEMQKPHILDLMSHQSIFRAKHDPLQRPKDSSPLTQRAFPRCESGRGGWDGSPWRRPCHNLRGHKQMVSSRKERKSMSILSQSLKALICVMGKAVDCLQRWFPPSMCWAPAAGGQGRFSRLGLHDQTATASHKVAAADSDLGIATYEKGGQPPQ